VPYNLTYRLGPITVEVRDVPDEIDARGLFTEVAYHPHYATGPTNDHFLQVADLIGADGMVQHAESLQVADDKGSLRLYMTGVTDRRALIERVMLGSVGARAAELRRRADVLDREAGVEEETGDEEVARLLRRRAMAIREEADDLAPVAS
jgi:hypothetical protein